MPRYPNHCLKVCYGRKHVMKALRKSLRENQIPTGHPTSTKQRHPRLSAGLICNSTFRKAICWFSCLRRPSRFLTCPYSGLNTVLIWLHPTYLVQKLCTSTIALRTKRCILLSPGKHFLHRGKIPWRPGIPHSLACRSNVCTLLMQSR
jgi:hypothetical protein